MHWLIQTVVQSVIALCIGMAIGYGAHWHRNRLKVTVETHIDQSWSDRVIHISIMNHGKAPITVDSWTVHMPLEQLLPEVAAIINKHNQPRFKHLSRIHRISKRIRHHMLKRDRLTMENDLNRAFARSMLYEPHMRHQLMAPGSTERIGPGESAVCVFPRTSTVPSERPIVSNTEQLTIIPSCHVVGRRRRFWGLPSFLFSGTIPMAARFTHPRIDSEDY